MNFFSEILNERDAREAAKILTELDHTLSSEAVFQEIIEGLPVEIVSGYRRALKSQRAELKAQLEAYEAAKSGDASELMRRVGNDPGLALIITRIKRGLSQKELARLLGLKEQQIQRYESERYRSISLSNYRRIAHVLGVRWEVKPFTNEMQWFGSGWNIASEIKASDVKKIIKHAKENEWFEKGSTEAEAEDYNYLQKYITDHILNYGSPAFLRTGINIENYNDDILLIAWKARVTRIAERIIKKNDIEYKGLKITWLRELTRLSLNDNGPALARDFLLSHGIVLVVEPQITGLKLDGAAFLVNNTPVIAMTLRRDTIDNFWYTLLHEIAHIILHYQIGLRSGFFDDIDNKTIDEIEHEANFFASNALVPEEKWKRSPARISKSPAPIEKLAKEVGIHPAILFGRIQKERGNYAIFPNKIGRGMVRKWLLEGKQSNREL